MKILFEQDPLRPNMDRLVIDGKRQWQTIPRWLFEMLPEDKRDIATNCLKDMFSAGFIKGQQMKSQEIQDLLNKLQRV